MDKLGPLGGNPLSGLITTLQNIQLSLQSIDQTLKAVFPLTTYATGTWTPALAFGGSIVGITYTTQLGTYTQIGREVTCRFRIVLTSKGAAAGAATIGGLPFAANADVTQNGSGGQCPVYANLASLTETPVLAVAPSAVAVQLETFGAAANAALDNTSFTNTSVLNGEFSYFV